MSKIITIWGNPNSGKTTLAIKLAKELSNNNNVIMLSTDIIAPTIGVLLPYSKEKDKSVGKLLEMVTLTQEDILKNLTTLKDNKNIAFLGYAQTENYKSYAEYTVDRANELIINLSHLADYLIIDTSSIIQLDLLSRSSLKLADEVIRLCGTNLKAISYYKSIFPLLIDKSYNINNHIKILAKLKDGEPKAIITNHYGTIFSNLPYTEELQIQYREGCLLDALSNKQSVYYNDNLEKLLFRITGKTKDKKNVNKVNNVFKLIKVKKMKEQDEDE